MSWNYRVIKKDAEFGIHEVYYNKRGEILCLKIKQKSYILIKTIKA